MIARPAILCAALNSVFAYGCSFPAVDVTQHKCKSAIPSPHEHAILEKQNPQAQMPAFDVNRCLPSLMFQRERTFTVEKFPARPENSNMPA